MTNSVVSRNTAVSVLTANGRTERHGGDAEKGGKEVAVTPHLVGFPGFLSQDGPFDAIVRSENLKAFETDAMKYAVDYKWKTYGQNVQLFIVILYVARLPQR